MRDEDRNYVLSSWLRSYAEGPEFRGIARGTYFALYEPVVKDILARSVVAIATLPEQPDVVIGWMAIEDEALHYALVKPRWRKLGIARWLLADVLEIAATYTHVPSGAFARLIPPTWTYDPMRRFGRRAA